MEVVLVNDITKPRPKAKWILEENGEEIEDEKEIADIFNDYFIQKMERLKENTNKDYVKEPLERLKKKLDRKNLKFTLNTVTEKKSRRQ